MKVKVMEMEMEMVCVEVENIGRTKNLLCSTLGI